MPARTQITRSEGTAGPPSSQNLRRSHVRPCGQGGVAERVGRHAERPGFRISEMRMSPTQQVPWHYHTNIQDTFYVLDGSVRITLRDPDEQVGLQPGESWGPGPPGAPAPGHEQRWRTRHLPRAPTDCGLGPHTPCLSEIQRQSWGRLVRARSADCDQSSDAARVRRCCTWRTSSTRLSSRARSS